MKILRKFGRKRADVNKKFIHDFVKYGILQAEYKQWACLCVIVERMNESYGKFEYAGH